MRALFWFAIILGLVACAPVTINISVGTTPTPNQPAAPTASLPPPATATPDTLATSAAQAQATGNAQATSSVNVVATAGAQSAATAQAQSTARAQQTAAAAATLQGTLAFVEALVQKGNKAYGPTDGILDKPPEATLIKTMPIGLFLRNFVAEAQFANPADGAVHPWDYGFLFRRGPGGRCGASYRLYVSSDQKYRMTLATGKTNPDQTCESKSVASGNVPLNVSPTGSNAIRLVVQDKSAFLFVNGIFQASLDVSEVAEQGDVAVGTAFQIDHGFPGLATPFKGFLVSALP